MLRGARGELRHGRRTRDAQIGSTGVARGHQQVADRGRLVATERGNVTRGCVRVLIVGGHQERPLLRLAHIVVDARVGGVVCAWLAVRRIALPLSSSSAGRSPGDGSAARRLRDVFATVSESPARIGLIACCRSAPRRAPTRATSMLQANRARPVA